MIDWNRIFRKLCAAALALLLTGLQVPLVPASAEDALSLRISGVEVSPTDIREDRQVSVDVWIEGNEKGFIAAEFGIVFDNRLVLHSIQNGSETASCFSYNSTSTNHMIWFSGANGSPESGATTGKTKLFTLDFILPADYAVGDVYYIGYEWGGVDGSDAFWYVNQSEDALTSLMSYSASGAISIPNPDAPKLNRSLVELNPNGTYTLSVQNTADAGVWFSDNNKVATVENGVVTAVAPGSCNVSVFLAEENALLTCEVIVHSEYRYSMLDADNIVITSADQVVYLEYPGAVGSIQWLSTNPNAVTVDDGKLGIVAGGTAQIIASNNGVSKMRTVIVQLDAAPETTTSSQPDDPALQSGDLNGDSIVDILDVITINKYLLGSIELTPAQKTAADVYADGNLDSTDGLTLLKYVVELISELPVSAG